MTLDYSLIAYNVRCVRMAHNLTQAELASVASVDKATVHRLEAGRRLHLRSIAKICKGLGQSVEFMNSVLPYGEPQMKRRLFIHRRADETWYGGADVRTRVPKDSQTRIQLHDERLRLGRLGLVGVFQAYAFAMPRGPGLSNLEVYGRVPVGSNPTYETAICYCLRGELIFRVDDEVISLAAGDGVGFSTDREATIEPANPIGPRDQPPHVVFITANRRGHVPIEADHRNRSRTRHPRTPKTNP